MTATVTLQTIRHKIKCSSHLILLLLVCFIGSSTVSLAHDISEHKQSHHASESDTHTHADEEHCALCDISFSFTISSAIESTELFIFEDNTHPHQVKAALLGRILAFKSRAPPYSTK